MTQTAELPERFLSLREVQARLGYSRSYIRRHYIVSGRLPLIKQGRTIRVSSRELDRLMSELAGGG